MATSKKFSQLPAASSITNNDLAAIAHEDALAETGYESQKATMIQIGKKLLGDIEYVTDLPGFPSDEQNPFAALVYLRDSILDLLPVDEVSGAVANFDTAYNLSLEEIRVAVLATGGGGDPQSPVAVVGFTDADISHSDANTSDPTVYPVTWLTEAGEIFGGELVLTHKVSGGYSAKLIKTWDSVDMGTMTWYAATSSNIQRFYGYLPGTNKLVKPNTSTDNERRSLKCAIYSTPTTLSADWGVTLANNNTCVISYAQSYEYMAVRDDRYSTPADFKTAMNGVMMFYKLNEQYYTEIDLPDISEDIKAFIGENNVWSDTGDTTVDYKLGIQKYIDKKIAQVQALVL